MCIRMHSFSYSTLLLKGWQANPTIHTHKWLVTTLSAYPGHLWCPRDSKPRRSISLSSRMAAALSSEAAVRRAVDAEPDQSKLRKSSARRTRPRGLRCILGVSSVLTSTRVAAAGAPATRSGTAAAVDILGLHRCNFFSQIIARSTQHLHSFFLGT